MHACRTNHLYDGLYVDLLIECSIGSWKLVPQNQNVHITWNILECQLHTMQTVMSCLSPFLHRGVVCKILASHTSPNWLFMRFHLCHWHACIPVCFQTPVSLISLKRDCTGPDRARNQQMSQSIASKFFLKICMHVHVSSRTASWIKASYFDIMLSEPKRHHAKADENLDPRMRNPVGFAIQNSPRPKMKIVVEKNVDFFDRIPKRHQYDETTRGPRLAILSHLLTTWSRVKMTFPASGHAQSTRQQWPKSQLLTKHTHMQQTAGLKCASRTIRSTAFKLRFDLNQSDTSCTGTVKILFFDGAAFDEDCCPPLPAEVHLTITDGEESWYSLISSCGCCLLIAVTICSYPGHPYCHHTDWVRMKLRKCWHKLTFSRHMSYNGET